MKTILFILFILALGWCCFGCGAGEPKHDWRDTLQKPLPDSILVKDTSIKDQETIDSVYKRKGGEQ